MASENQIRLIGRVPKQHAPNWKAALDYLLKIEQSKPWSLDISQHYFMRGGAVVFAWRIIVQGQNIQSSYQDLLNTLKAAPRAQMSNPSGTISGGEVVEQRLSVIGPRKGGVNARGKGASTAGTPPLIIQGGVK